ncbi:hypothetical protein RYX36_032993 [Vicia faba]
MKDAMLKKAAAKSPMEVAKLEEAFETCLEPPAIPDGVVDFLRQNSPSAEVNIRTKYPSSFNLKQIEESIKGAKINNYRTRFSMPSSYKLPRLSLRSSSSVAPALAVKSASAAEPATAASPNLHLCLGEKDDKSSNKDEEEKHQHNTGSSLRDNGQ